MFLVANPDYYDYIHRIQLKDDGTMLLSDGAGQIINFKGKANYKIEYDSDGKSGILKMSNIILENPYSHKHIQIDRSEMDIKFTIEYDQYILTQGRIWPLSSVFDEDLLIYNRRYIFEIDPLKIGHKTRQQNIFNIMEDVKELSERTYYDNKNVVRKTRKEWLEEGNSFNKNFYNTYDLCRESSDPIKQYLTDLSPKCNLSKNLEIFEKVLEESKKRDQKDKTIIDKIACLFSKNGECISFALTRWYYINKMMYAHILIYCTKDGYNDSKFIKNIVCYYDEGFIFDNEFDYKPFEELLCFVENSERQKSIENELQKYGLTDKKIMYCEKFDL